MTLNDLRALLQYMERELEDLSVFPVEDSESRWTGWECQVGNLCEQGDTPLLAMDAVAALARAALAAEEG